MKKLLFLALAVCLTLSTSVAKERAAKVTVRDEIVKALSTRANMGQFWNDLAQKQRTLQRAPASETLLKKLVDIVENEKERDEVRWATIFGIGRLAGNESPTILRRFLVHKNWILRDATLKTFAALQASKMRGDIEKVIKEDQALVVRTTAVDVIHHMGLKESTPALLEALSDSRNYRHGKPLWIHKHILSALKKLKAKDAAPRLAGILAEHKDPEFRTQIIATLEDLTGKNFRNRSMEEQVYLWKRGTVDELTF